MKRPNFLVLLTRSLELASAIALLAIFIGTASAQSGRRLPKSRSVPTPTPAPVEKKPVEETPAGLPVFVGIDQFENFGAHVPLYFFDSVMRACAERLDETSIEISIVQSGMNRSDAIKRAKAEKEAYVVWLQLRTDDAGSRDLSDLSEIFIEFVLFEPSTAKVKTSGRSYQWKGAGGGVAVPGTPARNTLPYTEYRLKQAARAAAERILTALNIK